MKREFSAQPMKGKRWSIIPVIMVLIAVFVLCAVAWTLLGQAPTEANESVATLEPSEGNKTVYPLPAQPMSLDQKYGSVYKLIFVEAGYFDDVPSICMEYFEAIEYAGQDMKNLQPGDTIMIDNEPVVVEEIKWMDTAMCTIIERGNLEAYNFFRIHNGNYTSSIELDVNASGVRLQSIGRAALPVSSDFVFIDYSTNTQYSFEELMALGQNPKEVLQDLQVSSIASEKGIVTEMGCGYADILEDPTQDTTDEAEDVQPDETPESSIEYDGTLLSMGKEDRYRINLFLSNFSEQYFHLSPDKFESETADVIELARFAWMHTKLNMWESFEYVTYEGYSYDAVDMVTINAITQRFFDRSIDAADIKPVVNSYRPDEYDIIVVDGKLCQPGADGDPHSGITIVKEMYDQGDETILVTFNIYDIYDIIEHDGLSGDTTIDGRSAFYFTPSEADAHIGFEYFCSGVAVVRPYTTESGKNTYQLVSYRVMN